MSLEPKDIVGKLDAISDRLSQQGRFASTAALAWAWGLTLASPQAFSYTTHRCRHLLMAIMVLAMASLGADLLQYIVAYVMSLSLLHGLEGEEKEGEFSKKSFAYRARMLLFWLKLALAVLAMLLVLYTGGVYLSQGA